MRSVKPLTREKKEELIKQAHHCLRLSANSIGVCFISVIVIVLVNLDTLFVASANTLFDWVIITALSGMIILNYVTAKKLMRDIKILSK